MTSIQVIRNVFLGVVCIIVIGCVALYTSLSRRLNMVEAGLAPALVTSAGARNDTGNPDPDFYPGTSEQWRPATGSSPARAITQTDMVLQVALLNRIQEGKWRSLQVNPQTAAIEMDRLIAMEPSLPSVEQTQTNALKQAIKNLPGDVPQPVGLQTTCQGRRCLVSGGFLDEQQASRWANAVLLAGGSGFPKTARIVPIPLGGNGGSVDLKLYLY